MDINEILLQEMRANRDAINEIRKEVAGINSGLNAFKAKAGVVMGLITFIANAAIAFIRDK